MSTSIIAIISIFIWIGVSIELVKSSKERNRRKVITLMFAGTLTTLILTVSLFQSILF